MKFFRLTVDLLVLRKRGSHYIVFKRGVCNTFQNDRAELRLGLSFTTFLYGIGIVYSPAVNLQETRDESHEPHRRELP